MTDERGDRGEAAGQGGGPRTPPRRQRLNVVLVVLATLGVLQLIYLNLVESDRMLVLNREVPRLEADVARLQAEEQQLLDVVAHSGDERYREQLARALGFIGPDELRVVTGSAEAGH